MSTGHANSATDMLARLENMVLMGMDLPLTAIRNQIASGVDVIVHLGRIRDKSRRVLEITEVVGCENGEIRLNPLYQFEELGENSEGKVVGRLRRPSAPDQGCCRRQNTGFPPRHTSSSFRAPKRSR